VLAEYRARLDEAREQAEDIVARARKAGDATQEEAKAEAKEYREQLLETTRKDIEAETRRALDDIRREVANLTIAATEKVTRKALDSDDQHRLIEEALAEVDFSALAGDANGGERA
jgi:F-type H+-transporting ATPase subunit b